MASLAASRRGDWTSACSIVDRMLAADSLDAWAWWRKNYCRWQLLANDSGTALARFRIANARLADLRGIWRENLAAQ